MISPGSGSLSLGAFPDDASTHVEAYTVHADPGWGESVRADAYDITRAERLSLTLNVPKNPITYAEAGGALEDGDYTPLAPLDPIMVTLDSASSIPSELLDSSYFQIHWTYDGSDPSAPRRDTTAMNSLAATVVTPSTTAYQNGMVPRCSRSRS